MHFGRIHTIFNNVVHVVHQQLQILYAFHICFCNISDVIMIVVVTVMDDTVASFNNLINGIQKCF